MDSDFKEYPLTVPAKDYWRQVKRTVNGEPVSEAQIQMIIDAICNCLAINEEGSDILLDLGCGNGALSQMLFGKIREFHGIDFSDYLISVAKRDFENLPQFRFEVAEVSKYLPTEPHPERFTKVLCYGCFSYFNHADDLLMQLYQRFINVTHVFIGNLPDRDRASQFYKSGLPGDDELFNIDSKIGIWRTQQEFKELALRAGWEAEFYVMPQEFYAAHYRYDVTLKRKL